MPLKLFNEPSPLETKVLSKRFGLDKSETLDCYLANDGFKAFLKAREMSPEQIIEEVKVSALRMMRCMGALPAMTTPAVGIHAGMAVSPSIVFVVTGRPTTNHHRFGFFGRNDNPVLLP